MTEPANQSTTSNSSDKASLLTPILSTLTALPFLESKKAFSLYIEKKEGFTNSVVQQFIKEESKYISYVKKISKNLKNMDSFLGKMSEEKKISNIKGLMNSLTKGKDIQLPLAQKMLALQNLYKEVKKIPIEYTETQSLRKDIAEQYKNWEKLKNSGLRKRVTNIITQLESQNHLSGKISILEQWQTEASNSEEEVVKSVCHTIADHWLSIYAYLQEEADNNLNEISAIFAEVNERTQQEIDELYSQEFTNKSPQEKLNIISDVVLNKADLDKATNEKISHELTHIDYGAVIGKILKDLNQIEYKEGMAGSSQYMEKLSASIEEKTQGSGILYKRVKNLQADLERKHLQNTHKLRYFERTLRNCTNLAQQIEVIARFLSNPAYESIYGHVLRQQRNLMLNHDADELMKSFQNLPKDPLETIIKSLGIFKSTDYDLMNKINEFKKISQEVDQTAAELDEMADLLLQDIPADFLLTDQEEIDQILKEVNQKKNYQQFGRKLFQEYSIEQICNSLNITAKTAPDEEKSKILTFVEILRRIEKEVDPLPTINMKVELLKNWLATDPEYQQPQLQEFINGLIIEYLNSHNQEGKLLRDLFDTLGAIEDNIDKIVFLENQKKELSYRHLIPKIDILIDEIKNKIDLVPDKISKNYIEVQLADKDPVYQLNWLKIRRHLNSWAPLKDYLEKKITDLEEILQNKGQLPDRETDTENVTEAKINKSTSEETIVTYQAAEVLQLAQVYLQEKNGESERHKFIKAQEENLPLNEEDPFYWQRRALFYLASGQNPSNRIIKTIISRATSKYSEKVRLLQALQRLNQKIKTDNQEDLQKNWQNYGVSEDHIAIAAVWLRYLFWKKSLTKLEEFFASQEIRDQKYLKQFQIKKDHIDTVIQQVKKKREAQADKLGPEDEELSTLESQESTADGTDGSSQDNESISAAIEETQEEHEDQQTVVESEETGEESKISNQEQSITEQGHSDNQPVKERAKNPDPNQKQKQADQTAQNQEPAHKLAVNELEKTKANTELTKKAQDLGEEIIKNPSELVADKIKRMLSYLETCYPEAIVDIVSNTWLPIFRKQADQGNQNAQQNMINNSVATTLDTINKVFSQALRGDKEVESTLSFLERVAQNHDDPLHNNLETVKKLTLAIQKVYDQKVQEKKEAQFTPFRDKISSKITDQKAPSPSAQSEKSAFEVNDETKTPAMDEKKEGVAELETVDLEPVNNEQEEPAVATKPAEVILPEENKFSSANIPDEILEKLINISNFEDINKQMRKVIKSNRNELDPEEYDENRQSAIITELEKNGQIFSFPTGNFTTGIGKGYLGNLIINSAENIPVSFREVLAKKWEDFATHFTSEEQLYDFLGFNSGPNNKYLYERRFKKILQQWLHTATAKKEPDRYAGVGKARATSGIPTSGNSPAKLNQSSPVKNKNLQDKQKNIKEKKTQQNSLNDKPVRERPERPPKIVSIPDSKVMKQINKQLQKKLTDLFKYARDNEIQLEELYKNYLAVSGQDMEDNLWKTVLAYEIASEAAVYDLINKDLRSEIKVDREILRKLYNKFKK
ncbi:MAG: hypothetical protein MJB14_01315 [Spirochaetes bacterium]|nr:hypothetical protein [Spirochaetota bacterium]